MNKRKGEIILGYRKYKRHNQMQCMVLGWLLIQEGKSLRTHFGGSLGNLNMGWLFDRAMILCSVVISVSW